MIVAAVQQNCTYSKQENEKRSKDFIRDAVAGGATLVVLPELHSGVYFPQKKDPSFFETADTIPGENTAFFAAIAKEYKVVLVCSFFEKDGDSFFNTAVVFETDGTIAGTYRKTHIPEDPGFHEKFYFSEGDQGIEPIDTSVGCLGVLLCWDQWFPETARTMAAKGAQLLIYPTAIGTIPDDTPSEQDEFREAWVIMQRSHSIANALPVVSVNRVGDEHDPTSSVGSISFWGSSFITSTFGELMAEADREEGILFANLNLDKTAKTRRMWPFYRDLREKIYRVPHPEQHT